MNTAMPDAASGPSVPARHDATPRRRRRGRPGSPSAHDTAPSKRSQASADERTTDDPLRFERVDLRPGEAEAAQELLVVLPEKRRVPLVQVGRASRELHRKRAVALRSDHRVEHLFEEVTGLELRELGLPVRLHHSSDRHTDLPEALDDHAGRPLTAPGCDELVDPVVVAVDARQPSPRQGRQPSPARPAPGGGTAIARRWRRRWPPRRRRGRPRPARPPGRGSGAPHRAPDCRRCPGRRHKPRTRSVARRRRWPRRSTIAVSTRPPSPVRSRCSRVSISPKMAWSPALGSPMQYGSNGRRSGCPVSHVSPEASSITKAKAASSRHGPSRPNPGIRSIMRSGRSARSVS